MKQGGKPPLKTTTTVKIDAAAMISQNHPQDVIAAILSLSPGLSGLVALSYPILNPQ